MCNAFSFRKNVCVESSSHFGSVASARSKSRIAKIKAAMNLEQSIGQEFYDERTHRAVSHFGGGVKFLLKRNRQGYSKKSPDGLGDDYVVFVCGLCCFGCHSF